MTLITDGMFAAVIVGFLMLGGQASLEPVRAVLPEEPGRRLDVTLPIPDGVALQQYVLRFSGAVAVPAAIELVKDESLEPGVVRTRRNARTVVVSGKTLGDALDLLVSSSPAASFGNGQVRRPFRWSVSDGILRVSEMAGGTCLDLGVQSFTVSDVTMAEALAQIHRLYDPGFPNARSEVNVQGMEKRVGWTGHDVTVRKVLDGLALAYGHSSWVARFTDSSGSYDGLRLSFYDFDGRGVHVSARSR